MQKQIKVTGTSADGTPTNMVIADVLPGTQEEFVSYIKRIAEQQSIPAIVVVNHDTAGAPTERTRSELKLPETFDRFFRSNEGASTVSAGEYNVKIIHGYTSVDALVGENGIAVRKILITHKTDQAKHKTLPLIIVDGSMLSDVNFIDTLMYKINDGVQNAALFHHAANVDARKNIVPAVCLYMKMYGNSEYTAGSYLRSIILENGMTISDGDRRTITIFRDKLLAEQGDGSNYARLKNLTDDDGISSWTTLGTRSSSGYVHIAGFGLDGNTEFYVSVDKKFMIIKYINNPESLRLVYFSKKDNAVVTRTTQNNIGIDQFFDQLKMDVASRSQAGEAPDTAQPSVEPQRPRQTGEPSAATVPGDVSRKRPAADDRTTDPSLPTRQMGGRADASASTSAATRTIETRYPQQLVIQLGDDGIDGRVMDARMNLVAKYRGDAPRPLIKIWANLDTPLSPTGALQAGHGALRVTLVGHGSGLNADNQPTMGGFTAAQVADRLFRTVPATLPINTLSLVGCDLMGSNDDGFAQQLARLTLTPGEGGRPARVETLHARDGVMMVAGVSLNDLQQHGRKGSATLITQEPGTSSSVNTSQVSWHNYKYTYRHDDVAGAVREVTIDRPVQRWMDRITTPDQPWLGEVVVLPARSTGAAAGSVLAPRAILVSGSGLRLFGAYRSLTGLWSALQAGNYREAATGAVAIGTDVLSEVAERRLVALGQKLLLRGAASGSVAKMRFGRLFARGAPALNLLTVPFDIYDAYVQFDLASRTEGQARVDALVYGGLATAQVTLAVATSIAAIALPIVAAGTGAAAAVAAAAAPAVGPVALGAAGLLLAAERGYTAFRVVQEVERWMPLNGLQKVKVVACAIVTNGPGSGINAEVMTQQLASGMADRYRQWLDSAEGRLFSEVILPKPMVAWRAYVEGPVNNPVSVVLATDHRHQHVYLQDQRPDNTGLCRAALSNIASDPAARCVEIKPIEDREFYINDTDDFIDATSGTAPEQLNSRSSKPILRITVAERPEASVYFDVGHGNDSVSGTRNRPNRFVLGSGSKTVHGGEHNDEIILSARPDFRSPPMLNGDLTWQTLGEQLNSYQYHFDGGAGAGDSLFLNTDLRDTPYRGYRVDLAQHSIAIIKAADPAETPARPSVHKLGVIHRIEHIGQGLDLSWDSYHHILGDDGANYLVGRSHDQLEGRAGNDILILADQAKGSGGEGIDTYQVWLRKDTDCVQIVDSSQTRTASPEFSRVLLHNLKLSQLASWRIEQGHLILRADNGGQLKVENLYRLQGDGQWCLDNPRFSFHTADGFSLVPVLPGTVAPNQVHDQLDFAASWLASADTQTSPGAGLSIDLSTGQIRHHGEAVHALAKPYRLYEAKGGAGDNEITGSRANEKLYSSGGRDILRGGGGADTFVIAAPTGEVTIETNVAEEGAEAGVLSTVSLPHACRDQLTLRVEGQDLLLEVRADTMQESGEGSLLQTLRLKNGLDAAYEPLIVRDRAGGMLGWQPGSPSDALFIQAAGQGDTWLQSSGLVSRNILIGRDGKNTLSALQGNTLLQGGEGADNYRLLSQGSAETPAEYWIDNRAEDGQEDRVTWRKAHRADRWGQLNAHKMGTHLVLSDGALDGKGTTTRLYLIDYYQADAKSRHISLSLIGGTDDTSPLISPTQLDALAEHASQAEATLPAKPTMAQMYHQIITAMDQFDTEDNADGLALSMPERAHTLPVLAAA